MTIPYGRQSIDEDDIAAVAAALRSDWLTTGPAVAAFEEAVAVVAGAPHGVAVATGTAGLHCAVFAAGLGPGDEVIVPPITFVASANAVLYEGATPVFADVKAGSLLLDPDCVEDRITPRTRAIVGVDYAGQPCDWDRLRDLATRHGLILIDDACHALGATFHGRPVGSLADLTVFSFHPVKHITTGEGGLVTTADPAMDRAMRRFRSHGIGATAAHREAAADWRYEQTALGFNYRITDLQCALGISQLRKAPAWLDRRRALAAAYDRDLEGLPGVRPLAREPHREHAYHLYVIRLDTTRHDREAVFRRLRADGIGVNVHYIPVHLQPYHRKRLGTGVGLCPVAEAAYEGLLSLPLHQSLTDDQRARVVDRLAAALG
ncbi:MAG: UDP-4-amino-4,6-dideoxy-N-acetyl-beta-L-altrosamine transaminase [Deltaproteobacteria bacterium]|nr:UDP-4-amino-4,6-dideoxy-N-acetyl-beta-L-altrosamine transaminase [Deltaproteobacteria bacterium]